MRTAQRTERILFLTPGCFDKGGISRYSRYQIEALREIVGPDRVRALSLMGPDAGGFETPFPVTWHGRDGSVTTAGRIGFAVRALREAMLWRPTTIWSAHVNFTPLVIRLAAVSGARTVLNVYGLELWSGLSAARRAAMARMTQVVADCHATADHVVREAMHPVRPSVIWDCVDLERFQPGPAAGHLFARYGLPDPAQRRIVLTLGRLSLSARHKGYERLIAAWPAVTAQVPDAHLVVAGKGDFLPVLRDMVAERKLTDCVTFTGPIDEADLAAIYRIADVFALVSDKGPGRGEGIPLTPLEAMASGVPVLVGNEDGSPEAVDRDRNGRVVSPRDPGAIISALVSLLSEDASSAQRRRKAARDLAEQRFGYRAFVEKHRTLIGEWSQPGD